MTSNLIYDQEAFFFHLQKGDDEAFLLSDSAREGILPEMYWDEVVALYDPSKHELEAVASSDGHTYYTERAVTRTVLCRVILKDDVEIDPCIIYSSETDFENLKYFQRFAFARDVKAILSSPKKLPHSIMKAAAQAFDPVRGTAIDLMVRCGNQEVLICGGSKFYDHDGILGKDIAESPCETRLTAVGTGVDNPLIIFADLGNFNRPQKMQLEDKGAIRQTVRDKKFFASRSRFKKRR